MLQGSRHRTPHPALVGALTAFCWSLGALGAPKPADTDAPVIQHAAMPTIPAGDVSIDFTVSDQSALFSVILHWRLAGERDYKDIDFPTKETTFQADLKGITKDLEFWIEAYDEYGNGPALDGTAERPNRSRIMQQAPPKDPTPPPEPPKPPITIGNSEPEPEIPGGTPTPIQPHPHRPPPPPPPQPFVSDHAGRIGAARNLPAGRLEAELDGSFFWGTNFVLPDTAMNGEEGRLGLAFAPLDLIGFRVSSSFRRAQFTTTAANASSNFPLTGASLSNWRFSARVASPKLGVFRFAAEPSLAIPPSSWCEPVNGVKTCGGAFVVSPGITALASLDLPFLRAHVNAGYLWDNSAKVARIKSLNGDTVSARPSGTDMFMLGLSDFDTLSVGAAIEAPLGNFTPYVEWQLDVPMNRAAFARCTPSEGKSCRSYSVVPVSGLWQMADRLGGGVRIDFNDLVRLDLGFEASLTAAGNGLKVPSTTASEATAEPIAVTGVSLPPPFLLRAALNWQFDLFAKPTPAPEHPPVDAAPAAAPKGTP